MRTTRWLMTAILGLLLTGCAGISTAPTPEARQALAPREKLRVGLYLGNPLSVVRDSPSGEMKLSASLMLRRTRTKSLR